MNTSHTLGVRLRNALAVTAISTLNLIPADALAQDAAIKVSVNRRGAQLDRAKDGAAGGATYFTAYLEQGKSYECAIYGNNTSSTGSDPGAAIDIGNITDGTSNTIQVSERGNASPPINGDGSADNRNKGRVTLTPVTTGIYRFPYSLTVPTSGTWPGGGTGDYSMWADCSETTLYGGFNTFVNNFNFLELTNISNTEISGKYTLTDFNGAIVVNQQSFSLPAGRRLDFDLHTPVGAKYGTVVVTHDGNSGSLRGYVSQYSGTASSLTLSTSLPLSERSSPNS